MSNHDLRDDKECENCGYTVDRLYCSKCGQKNVETRQSFGHLITHFAEDLTHYDSSFWKTIKYLLFKPAKLTKEYLSGKRQIYVPPVKLYIFISFLTFFIIAILPDFSKKEKDSMYRSHTVTSIKTPERKLKLDEKENVYFRGFVSDSTGAYVYNPVSYQSVKEMDSIENIKPDSLRLSSFQRGLAKKLIHLYEHNTPQEVGEKLYASIPHNIPKAIFLYMPLFAFWLWLFHGKKRWYFFDHGIFTLHYFCFLLLGVIFLSLLYSINTAFNNGLMNTALSIISILILLWQIFYFYRSHRKMYNEGFVINFIKSTALFIINMSSILFVAYLLMAYTFHNLH